MAELWRLTMETGQVVDVIVVNVGVYADEDRDRELFRHVPPHTTIYSRELLTRYSHSPFSFVVTGASE
jgi:hypothetical protein